MQIKQKNSIILTISFIISLILSNSPAFALSAGELNSVTGGTVGFNSATKTTIITTGSATTGAITDVNWNKFNIGVGETLTNSFTGQGQTIINRVLVIDPANISTIAGTINATGAGAAYGRVVLVNPNGIVFNGAIVNVPGLLVSALNTSAVMADQINVLGGVRGNINIYNSTITAPGGAAFVTNGNIDVRNSTIQTADGYTGCVQLITADGVNFKYSPGGSKLRLVIDDANYSPWTTSSSDSRVTANNATGASQISVANSTLQVYGTAKQPSHILLSANGNGTVPADVIVYGSTALKSATGTITITAYSKNNSNFGNVKLYPDITPTGPSTAKSVVITGSHSALVNNIAVTNSVRYNKRTAGTSPADPPKALTIPEQVAADAAEQAERERLAQLAKEQLEKDRLAALERSNLSNNDPQKYLPKIDGQQVLTLKPNTTMAGAAAKIRHKQSSARFIGHFDEKGNKSIKYYEILK